MSAVYNLEPQPTAKVLLETTSGELLLELFAKQTPLASRNFIQLCLEGYYDGTIFHRLVPSFIIQGGDPTGTGDGGEAVYDGGVFEDEFHSRLKFNRRGLLGMANSGQKNDNGSQFFLTLANTEELNNKNTMFGRIVGDTMYNLMKMADAELAEGEGSERPLYPTKITRTEVILNPFDDIVPRKPRQVDARALEEKHLSKKPKKKAGKALLSFGGDDEMDVDTPVLRKAKFNPKLVQSDLKKAASDTRETKLPPSSTKSKKRKSPSPPSAPPEVPAPELQLPIRNEETPSRSQSGSSEPEQVMKMSTLLDRTNAQIAEMKQSMKRSVPAAAESRTESKSALERMIPASAVKGRKRKHGNSGQGASDNRALEMLNAFQAKLDQGSERESATKSSIAEGKDDAHSKDGNVVPEEEAELCDLHFIANCQSCMSWDDRVAKNLDGGSDDDSGWLNHTLVFERDRFGKDLNWKENHEDGLIVIDPREKAKDIKAEQSAKKSSRRTDHTIGNMGRNKDKRRD